jgi:hypothetical protein
MYNTGNQYTNGKSFSSVCDLKIDHNCARLRDNSNVKGVHQVVTKKAEISFGEGDSQRRNLLKLSIKKYE